MAKANTIRKTLNKKSTGKPAINPATLPDLYSLKVSGDCMEPGIKHGAVAQFSRTESYGPGDIVCIWFQAPAKMGASCALKRLRLAIPPWVKEFPYEDHPESDVAAAVVFESDNPRRTYSLRCSDIAAIHKFIGCQ